MPLKELTGKGSALSCPAEKTKPFLLSLRFSLPAHSLDAHQPQPQSTYSQPVGNRVPNAWYPCSQHLGTLFPHSREQEITTSALRPATFPTATHIERKKNEKDLSVTACQPAATSRCTGTDIRHRPPEGCLPVDGTAGAGECKACCAVRQGGTDVPARTTSATVYSTATSAMHTYCPPVPRRCARRRQS